MVWILAILVSASAIALYAFPLDSRRNLDDRVYSFVGQSWLAGDWPYRDVWDHKGPLVYVASAARIALLGPAPERMVVQDVMLGVACALLLAAIAYRLWGSAASAIGFVAGVLVWAQHPASFGHMTTVGSIVALLNTGGVLTIFVAVTSSGRRRLSLLLTAGLLGGLALCVKPNAATCLALGFLGIVLVRDVLRRDALILVLGALLPPVFFALVFAAAGALGQMLDAVIAFNVLRGSDALASQGSSLLMSVVRQLRATGVLVLVIAAVAACVFALRNRRQDLAGGWIDQPLVWLVPAWVVLELVILASNGAWRHHVYPVFPAVALVVPWFACTIARRVNFSRAQAQFIILLMALGSMLLNSWSRVDDHRQARETDAEPAWRFVAKWLRTNTEPDARILAFTSWEEPLVLTLADRRTAIPFFYPTPLWARGNQRNDPWTTVEAALESDRPPSVLILNVSGLEIPASGPSAVWAVQRLDTGLLNPQIRASPPAEKLDLVKRHVLAGYELTFCRGELCVLESLASAEHRSTTSR